MSKCLSENVVSRKVLKCLLLLVALSNSSVWADSISVRPIVQAPDVAHLPMTRKHEGIPSLAVSPKNGRFWCVWYGGPTGGEDSNNYLVLSTRAADEKSWHEVLVVDPDGAGPLRAFDPEVWIAPDGRLIVFWSERHCPLAASSKNPYSGGEADPKNDGLWMMALSAESEPCSNALPVPRKIACGVMMCKPIADADGTWLLPVSNWREDVSSVIWATKDAGRTFVRRGGTGLPKDERLYDEQNVVRLKDGTLEFWTRTRSSGIWTARSTDDGMTWTPYTFRMQHTSSRFFLRRLPSGALLLVRHGAIDSNVGRRDLTAFVSDDEGRTWIGGLLLDARAGVSYPDGDIAPDGTIFVVHDRDRLTSREILVSTFTEGDVRARRDVSGRVRLCEVVSSNLHWMIDKHQPNGIW